MSQLVKHERIETTVAKVFFFSRMPVFSIDQGLVVGGQDLGSRRGNC